jgi:hypothetical protein
VTARTGFRSGALQRAMCSAYVEPALSRARSFLGGRSFSSDKKTRTKRNTARGAFSASLLFVRIALPESEPS